MNIDLTRLSEVDQAVLETFRVIVTLADAGGGTIRLPEGEIKINPPPESPGPQITTNYTDPPASRCGRVEPHDSLEQLDAKPEPSSSHG